MGIKNSVHEDFQPINGYAKHSKTSVYVII